MVDSTSVAGTHDSSQLGCVTTSSGQALEPKIQIEDFSIRYSDGVESLRGITLDIYARQINVLLGPAGGGKSTLLRAFNRLNDLVDVEEQTGRILLDGQDIYGPQINVTELRRRVGMVFASLELHDIQHLHEQGLGLIVLAQMRMHLSEPVG